MIKKIAIVGGDLRIVELAKMLANDKYEVSTYGMEKAKFPGINLANTLEECIEEADMIIGPLPLSSNAQDVNMPFSYNKLSIQEFIEKSAGKSVIAGVIKPEIYELAKIHKVNLMDIVKREELAVLNAISTAEGALQIAISETSKNLHGNKVLVMGFGRIGKILAKMLDGIGARVSCEARKTTDLAWIQAYGYERINLIDLKSHLGEFDIIFNTIPYMVLDKENLKETREDALIIDLASNPGGVDREAVKQLKRKFIWALSLPGKVSPITSAQFMQETLYNMFKEIEANN